MSLEELPRRLPTRAEFRVPARRLGGSSMVRLALLPEHRPKARNLQRAAARET
jgi:hypothetical protein